MTTGWERVWPAPAKLNLLLRILGRRPDGYHELQTVFQLVDLCDGIELRLRDDAAIVRSREIPQLPADEDLCVRAARRLQELAGVRRGVEITLHKRIPIGGGLGGGSSDAATVLRVLNHLWNAGLAAEDLARIGLELGADVPVFVAGYNAWAEGVGEKLTPIELPMRCYLIVQPDCTVSTARIFAAPELTRSSAPLTIQGFLAAGGGNDCTNVVVARHPQVGEALSWLGQYGPAALSGTGSCVFLSCDDAAQAGEVLARLPSRWRGWVAPGLARSPLNALLPELA